MTQDTVLDLVQNALRTVIITAAPPLVIGLAAGLIMSIFQTITSIQEPTLAFIPKILAVLLSLVIFGSFMLTTLSTYMTDLFNQLPDLLIPR